MAEIELSETTVNLIKDMFMGEPYTHLGELIDALFLSLREFFKEYQHAVSIDQIHIIRRGDFKPLCGSLAHFKTCEYDIPEDLPFCDDCNDIYRGVPEYITKN